MRRSLQFCLVLTTLLAITGFKAPDTALAQSLGNCRPTYSRYLPPQICATGVPSAKMNSAFQFQKTPVWCWAASMAMILAYNDKSISQSSIVRDIFGAEVPSELPPGLIQTYLDHTYSDDTSGDTATTSGSALFLSPLGSSAQTLATIVSTLQGGQPLLVLTPTHAMVLTAIYYYADAQQDPVGVAGVVVRDPFPYQGSHMPVPGIPLGGNPGERVLAPQEYYSIQAVFSVDVSS